MYTLLRLNVVGEGLGLYTKQIALPSLRIRGDGAGGCVEGIGGEGVGIWIGFFFEKNLIKNKYKKVYVLY